MFQNSKFKINVGTFLPRYDGKHCSATNRKQQLQTIILASSDNDMRLIWFIELTEKIRILQKRVKIERSSCDVLKLRNKEISMGYLPAIQPACMWTGSARQVSF